MINQFIKQLGSGLEQAAETLGKLPKEEIQAQLHQVARNTLMKMDLVTREEFEVQAAMLAKYRERLMALEARIVELETPAPIKKAPAKRAPAAKKPAVKKEPAAKKEPAVKKAPVKKVAAKAAAPKVEQPIEPKNENTEAKE